MKIERYVNGVYVDHAVSEVLHNEKVQAIVASALAVASTSSIEENATHKENRTPSSKQVY